MKILFFTTAHNSLSQRAFVELVDRGYRVTVVIASSEDVMLEAVEREHPDRYSPIKILLANSQRGKSENMRY